MKVLNSGCLAKILVMLWASAAEEKRRRRKRGRASEAAAAERGSGRRMVAVMTAERKLVWGNEDFDCGVREREGIERFLR